MVESESMIVSREALIRTQILLQFSLMPRRALLAPGSQAPLRGPRSPFLCRILVRLSVMLLLFLKWEAEAKAPLL